MFEDYETKKSVAIVYTGNGKGKTSASLGLLLRSLGAGWRVSYVQFVKHWEVSEHKAIKTLQSVYGENLDFYKGGKGFYNAGKMSAKNVSEEEHREAAMATYEYAFKKATSGDFDLVICDEINNSVKDGLLDKNLLKKLLTERHEDTSICVTGRSFPRDLVEYTDIATNMTKIKHHFDQKFLANEGIDY